MKTKLFLIFGLIVIIPVGSLLWLGLGYAQEEQSMYRFRLLNLLQEKLSLRDAQIREIIELKSRNLNQWLAKLPSREDQIRQAVAEQPDINQIFILNSNNEIRFPNPKTLISQSEEDFLYRTQRLRQELIDTLNTKNGEVQGNKAKVAKREKRVNRPKAKTRADKSEFEISISGAPSSTLSKNRSQESWNAQPHMEQDFSPENEGWVAWFWEEGLNVVYWKKSAGKLYGVELHRVKLLSDIIGKLPSSEANFTEQHPFTISLTDSRNQIVYQWGTLKLEKTDKPLTSIPLSFPLNAWTLAYYGPKSLLTSSSPRWSIFASLIAVFITLVTLAIYFYRENSREIREAQQRVNFVNQVSHELKTPLTNIRMYAELVQEDEDDVDQKTVKRINVIVSESQRLSRMIANVLSFSKEKNNKLQLHLQTGIIDECVTNIIKNFSPSLKKKQMEIRYRGEAKNKVKMDCDVIEQILNNMISNAEKYASEGKYLDIHTSQDKDTTTIIVQDFGQGISKDNSKKIFNEFYRIHNTLHEGVSGAGIGLSIARKLARLHGGDIVLSDKDNGCSFCITLMTPKVKK